jgi:glycosyltransferase involved in cell wall biosynthesis
MKNKQSILLLLPGPKYQPKKTLAPKLALLSNRYQGVVFTTSNSETQFDIGSFRVISGVHNDSTIREYQNFKRLIFEGLKTETVKNIISNNPLIVTYDPLRTGLIGTTIKKRLKVPLIVEVNGIFQAKNNYIDINNSLKRSAIRMRNIHIARYVLKRADGIKKLFPDQLKGLYKPQNNQIVRSFFDWVPTDKFENQKRASSEEQTILFAGFPHYLKGVDILINAFKSIYPRHLDWKLIILGWYENKQLIHDAIAGHPAITYQPPVLPHEMPDFINNCSIFVLPSRCEGMGRVLIEAAAAGKARLASNTGGIPTVIQDGVDGLLFQTGNQGDLQLKLSRLMNEPELVLRLGEHARARVESEFSDDSYLNNLDEFYSSI